MVENAEEQRRLDRLWNVYQTQKGRMPLAELSQHLYDEWSLDEKLSKDKWSVQSVLAHLSSLQLKDVASTPANQAKDANPKT
jgi:hypothetical protein